MIRRLPRYTLLCALAAACSSQGYSPPPPVAVDLHGTTVEDMPLYLASLFPDRPQGAIEYGQPVHGVLTSSNELESQYTPDPGFHGTETFSYTVSNEAGRATANITIDVTSNGLPYQQAVELDDNYGSALAVGDLTLDGRDDVVVMFDDLTVLANTSPGQAGEYAATPFHIAPGGANPTGIALADVDGDGKLDMIVSSDLEGVIVLRNLTQPGGGLAFDAPVVLPAGANVRGVIATDLNGDGRPDIASIDYGDDYGNDPTLDVRIDTSTPGTISFGALTSFALPANPIALAAIDTGSSGPSIAVIGAGPTTGMLSLFADATAAAATVPAFAARVDREATASPDGVFSADLDGDGRAELGVVNKDWELQIFVNRATPGAPLDFESARIVQTAIDSDQVVAPVSLAGTSATDLFAVGGEAQAPQFSELVNTTSPASGIVFDEHTVVPGAPGVHGPAMQGSPTGIATAELDGVPPREIVMSTTGGTYVLYGR